MDGGIEPRAAHRAGAHPVLHDQSTPDPCAALDVADQGGDRDRAARTDGVGHVAELGEAGPVDLFDEDVDDPAAGQPDGEGVVVADPVALQHRVSVVPGALGEFVDRTLHAPA